MIKPNCWFFVALLFLAVLGQSKIYAQGTSNKGKDFWVAYQAHIDNSNSILTLFITSDKNAKVNIDASGVTLPQVNVIAGQAIPVTINPTVYTNTYLSGTDIVQTRAGIHVT